MSFIVIAATAAASLATPAAVHTVTVDHDGSPYAIEYHAKVATSTKVVGIAPSTRTSTQRCIVTAAVSVDRIIAGHHALRAELPVKQSYSRQFPGDCSGRADEASKLVAAKTADLNDHLTRVAAQDRPQALAAIEAARHLAAN